MPAKNTNKIALFTMAVGKDPVYFHSARRYFPYNKENFGQSYDADYYVFTDRDEIIDGMISIPCTTTVWPYTALLKNNTIADYLNKEDKWSGYSHIFFIDADFAIGDKYDFIQHDFVMLQPYWDTKVCGGFYGGKTEYFRKLTEIFYDEMSFICNNKLSVPQNLDEFYLTLFYDQYREQIYRIKMNQQTNTLIFYDNEDLDEKIRQTGERLFLHPYKAEGRSNKTLITDAQGKQQECIVNLKESYIFNNYSYDFGRLLQIDENQYRIFWSRNPERREVLDISTNKIGKQPAGRKTRQASPVLSIVMPVYNVKPEYLKESIESILNQTYGDFELLIIDDGSTETEGIDVIKSYRDSRICLIRNHHDFIDSLNKGVSESKGKYIIRMDADDIMLPRRLATQYEFMEEHPEVDVCGSWMKMFGNVKDTVRVHAGHKEIVSILLLQNTMAHPTVILRKASICKDKTDLYKKGYDCAEDYKLWTDLAMNGLRFANIPEILLKYRSSESQVTNIRQKEIAQSEWKIQQEYIQQVMQQISDRNEAFFELFEPLISLYNNDLINWSRVLNIVYEIYSGSL